MLLTKVNGIKLTLKQDLNKLQEQLEPEHIGQFLHSINDLPKLAEILDPSRSRLNFDLLFYYNHYGCCDEQVFNWKRITQILTYGGLSRYDRLILLNGNCIANWPGILTLELYNLRYLLSLLPEINPLLLVSPSNCEEPLTTDVIAGDAERWKVLIEAASSNWQFNFIPAIDLLFKKDLVGPEDFDISNFNLIGPEAIDSCFNNSKNLARTQLCYSLVFSPSIDYKQFKARDLFYRSLNIGIIIKYDSRVRLIKFLRTEFDKIFEACDELNVKSFIELFSKMISEYLMTDKIKNQTIFNIFKVLLEEEIFLAIEFYKWLELNLDSFGIDENYLNTVILKRVLFKTISNQKLRKPDDFLNFIINKRRFCGSKCFQKFLQNNYDPVRPSNELIKAFRQLSWISGNDGGFEMTKNLKKFLDFEFRISFLRKLSFDHPKNYEESSSIIEIYLNDTIPNNISMFNGVFESLMRNITLVYPLECEAKVSGTLKGLIKESIDLKTILQKFWDQLGSYANGFMKHFDFDYEDGSELELVPNPWTHPNVLLAAGCCMTLALLNGIKLTGWQIKKSIFESVFKIDFTSISDVEESHFLMFYTINDYLSAIEASNDSKLEEAIKDLLEVTRSLSPVTRKALKNFRNNLLKKNQYGFYSLKPESDQIWSSKIFQLLNDIETTTLSDTILKDSDSLMTFLNPYVMEITPIDDDLVLLTSESSNLISERDSARIQIYSLFLGLQPLTRFLDSDEAYNTIFSLE